MRSVPLGASVGASTTIVGETKWLLVDRVGNSAGVTYEKGSQRAAPNLWHKGKGRQRFWSNAIDKTLVAVLGEAISPSS